MVAVIGTNWDKSIEKFMEVHKKISWDIEI